MRMEMAKIFQEVDRLGGTRAGMEREVLRHRGVCRGYGRSLAAASCDCGSGEVHQSGACNFQAETLWQGRGPVHVLQVSHHENRYASEHTDACNGGGQGRHDSYRCHAEENLHRRAAAAREHSEGRHPFAHIKNAPEFSEESMGAFALPAKSSTNKEKAFSQVASCLASGLRMRRISKCNSNPIGSMEGHFLAKPVFGAVRA